MAAHYQQVEGWFDFEDVYELALRRLGGGRATFCEVGAYKGKSTCYMAERIRECGAPVEFHVVDTFAGDPHVGAADVWPDFVANMTRAGTMGTVEVHRRPSPDAAADFEDGSLDFVFIDAEHTHDAVARDLAAWWPKVRRGGLLAGHDYASYAGVRAAVDAFVSARGAAPAFRTSGTSWMVHKSIAIDAAFCVNLASRPDRRRAAREQFRAVGLHDRVEFFDAVDGRALSHPRKLSDGQAGCVASHLGVMRAAAERGARHALVFEDDVAFVPGFATSFPIALSRCPASFELFYLGALCRADWGNYLHPFDDVVARAGHVFGTHAYVVDLACLPEMEGALGGMTCVLDHHFALELNRRGNSYVCTPFLAMQSPGFSDVAGAYTDPRSYVEYVYR